MTDTKEKIDEFFERYASALLARDEKAISQMYAVPSLILFPGNSIIVSDTKQTEEFFASTWRPEKNGGYQRYLETNQLIR